MIGEDKIKLAAKLYKCRDTAKRLYGDQYKSKMVEYGKIITAAMKKHKLDSEVEAAMKIIEEAATTEKHDGSGITIMNLLAAAVEMIEPS